MKGRIKQLFEAIDKKDAALFVSFLAKDASFRFGNAPEVRGRENIQNGVAAFFGGIKGLRHRVRDVWEQDNVIICEGEVTYTRPDGSELTVPFADILRLKGDLIADYRIYMDISPLASPSR
jgi:ketosteroid isomerase-like protein